MTFFGNLRSIQKSLYFTGSLEIPVQDYGTVPGHLNLLTPLEKRMPSVQNASNQSIRKVILIAPNQQPIIIIKMPQQPIIIKMPQQPIIIKMSQQPIITIKMPQQPIIISLELVPKERTLHFSVINNISEERRKVMLCYAMLCCASIRKRN